MVVGTWVDIFDHGEDELEDVSVVRISLVTNFIVAKALIFKQEQISQMNLEGCISFTFLFHIFLLITSLIRSPFTHYL